ncbi:MAG: glutathione synthase/RimK-type ligase-like ATP-grasp enzyme [Paraglaciecola sp.]|jgi:glutathione synthase/RimK-type ligase-like ATP-grasp enzyme
MKRCAFLSMDSLEGFYAYDYMLFAPLKAYGWQAEEVSWHKADVDWNQYDVVVVRSTWDYQENAEAFVSCLQRIDASSAVLANSMALLLWNINKTYLQDIAGQGINIVPTDWFETFDLADVAQSFAHFGVEEIVLKPTVSANADHTYRLNREQLLAQGLALKEIFSQRPFMVQPFLPAVLEEGEYSLFYFNGHYSHCILKQPKADDFRVQEEHGGQLTSVQPTEEMLTQARHTMAAMPDDALYARIDLLRCSAEFAVMEIELIEPSLYFNMDENSAQFFADAFIECFGQG